MDNQDKNGCYCQPDVVEFRRLLREQRHDFMNMFQIIYGYIKLGKIDKAIYSVNKVIELNSNISKLYSLSIFTISLFMDKKIREFTDFDMKINLAVKNMTDYEIRSIENEKEILESLISIFDKIMDRDIKDTEALNISIFEFDEGISFLFEGENKIARDISENEYLRIEVSDVGIKYIFKYKNPKQMCVEKSLFSDI